jgi:hypothetical protein
MVGIGLLSLWTPVTIPAGLIALAAIACYFPARPRFRDPSDRRTAL